RPLPVCAARRHPGPGSRTSNGTSRTTKRGSCVPRNPSARRGPRRVLIALLITVGYVAFVWAIFFRWKLLAWSITWAVVSAFMGIHVLLIFLIGVRFVAPYSADARVI